jgi:hypothetical protein
VTLPNDWRALCAIAVELWDADCDMESVVQQMRTALDQPEPQWPPDEELLRTYSRATAKHVDKVKRGWQAAQVAGLRVVLARYGTAHPAPEAVGVTDEVVENAACILYTAMRFERMESTPAWVERGNSDAQVVAREVARTVLTLYTHPAPVPVEGRLPGARP